MVFSTMTKVSCWLLLLCVAACHHDVSPTTVSANQPSSCDQLADHLVSLMTAAQHARSEDLDPYRNLISKRCTQDHWGTDAQRCLGATTTIADGDRCEKLLTDAQAKALELDGEALAGAARPPVAEPARPATAPARGMESGLPAPTNPPKSPGKSKGAGPKGDSDPCEGGE